MIFVDKCRKGRIGSQVGSFCNLLHATAPLLEVLFQATLQSLGSKHLLTDKRLVFVTLMMLNESRKLRGC